VVTLGASQATATITNTTLDSLYGVAMRAQQKMNLIDANGSNGAAPYYTGEAVSMLTKGRIYVLVEDAITSDSDVYLRFAPSGLNTQVGRFRSDDDSGTAVLIPGAVWRVGASSGELAVLEINMPN
jgi:hypothetical protein